MKKLVALISFIVLVTAFSACTNNVGAGSAKLVESGEKLVVIEATETGGSLEDALKALKQAGSIEFEGSVGEFGFYLTSLNGYVPDAAKNEYWGIFTSLGEYGGVVYSSEEFGVYEYNGTVYASASYGISGMPLVEGEIYVLTVATY